MKKISLMVFLLSFLFAACKPSNDQVVEAISVGLTETQAAIPTITKIPPITPSFTLTDTIAPSITPSPTITPTPTITSTPTPAFINYSNVSNLQEISRIQMKYVSTSDIQWENSNSMLLAINEINFSNIIVQAYNTNDGQPIWELDADKISISPDQSKIITVQKLDGVDILQLVDSSNGEVLFEENIGIDNRWYNFSWSSDSKQLMFSSKHNGFYDLYWLNLEIHEINQLTKSKEREIWKSWIFDNEGVSFIKWNYGSEVFENREVPYYLYLNDTDTIQEIGFKPPIVGTRIKPILTNTRGFYWSPDNSKVALLWKKDELASTLFILDVETGNQKEIIYSPDTRVFIETLPRSIFWSNDGSKLIFLMGWYGGGSALKIYDVATDKISTIELSCEGYHWSEIKWSPDGELLAFSFDNKNIVGRGRCSNYVQIVNINTGDSFSFPSDNGHMIKNIAWSIDSTVLSMNTGNSIIFWDVLNNTEVINITAKDGYTIHSTSWSIDGKYFAYSTSEGYIHIWGFEKLQ